jgi:hypothetical protein
MLPVISGLFAFVASLSNHGCVPPFTQGVIGQEIELVLGQALRPLVHNHS